MLKTWQYIYFKAYMCGTNLNALPWNNVQLFMQPHDELLAIFSSLYFFYTAVLCMGLTSQYTIEKRVGTFPIQTMSTEFK